MQQNSESTRLQLQAPVLRITTVATAMESIPDISQIDTIEFMIIFKLQANEVRKFIQAYGTLRLERSLLLKRGKFKYTQLSITSQYLQRIYGRL